MGLPVILLLGGGAYLLWKTQQAPTAPGAAASVPGSAAALPGGVGTAAAPIGDISFSAIGPGSDPRTWYQGIKPGSVTVGGQPGGAAWQPGGNPAKTALALTSTGISGITSISGMAGGFLGAATAPLFGVGIAITAISTVMGIISAHHQAALAAEGKALNTADPNMLNAMVMVMQAALAGEITSAAAAQSALNQIVQDWYGEVKGIQRGTWHYTLTPAQDPSVVTADPTPGEQNWFGAGIAGDRRPDPCNAACVVGHYFTERNAAIALYNIQQALAGQHGVMTFPQLPAHDTQSGFPEVQVIY